MSMLTYNRSPRAVVVAVLCAVLASCSAGAESSATANRTPSLSTAAPTGSSPTGSPPTSTPSGFPAVPASPSAVTERCGSPQGPAATVVRIPATGGTLTAFDTGQSTTVAILLHQTNGGGFCGWWPYASWLVTTHDVRAIGVDLCGYGGSRCSQSLSDAPRQQVAAAVRWAKGHGARRVVLVGASMGGSVALDAAARVPVAAVVDLSGPAYWPGTDLDGTVGRLRVPTLVAISDSTDFPDHQLLQEAFPRIPARVKRFVTTDPGHGYSLLVDIRAGVSSPSALAEVVAGWIRGDYSGA